MKSRMKLMSLALLGAFAAPAFAATNAEIEEMQAQLRKMQVKIEALEDSKTSAGFDGLKISGMMDPTYIYNQRRDSAGFNFLNNLDYRDDQQVYAYDNSYFGQVLLQVEKEMEGGTKWKLALVPHKSASSGYNVGSIVHEANVSIPLTSLQTRLIAGQYADWSGYEYYFGHQNKLVTHNLLFDFTLPSFYQGAGLEIAEGKWLIKMLAANMNKTGAADTEKDPVFTYRVDYSKGEYDGFGFAGQHGRAPENASGNFQQKHIDMFEVDGYFIRGDWSLFGQVSYGKWKEAASAIDSTTGKNKDAEWKGVSVYAGYKITPRFEVIARGDYIDNAKNGGNTFGATAGTCSLLERDPTTGALTGNLDPITNEPIRADSACAEGRNGFGPGMQQAADSGEWEPIDLNKGVKRSALSLGMNYVVNTNTSLKFEYRYDTADQAVFYDVKTGGYEKTNSLIGGSVVVSF